MAFGSAKRKRPVDDDDVEEVDPPEVTENATPGDADGAASGDPSDDDGREEDDAQNGITNPILAEITFLNKTKGKNDGGSRNWRCNHCKQQYKSSLTRMKQHFFGTQNGKKASIARCEVLRNNRVKYQELYDKFNKATEKGDYLKSNSGAPKRPLQDAFRLMEREAVDLTILECMAANGVPFNIFRSPFFAKMVAAINNAPKGYKAPSSEKARTSLLDACKRKVENDLSGVRDTWYVLLIFSWPF
ncbi:hypothetical protein HU200_019633 [Digitaria exilis]|uniref:BED-type domain-containing protein n=1 Tax=Digitaria exilis TaxID=1010633 RepID=A0A835KIA9_9POAL|nr:hypothetical protein HU200_019633 [Digitaria exilis]